ncbi:MAG: class I adenylate-forming enzyme family protein [Halobacteriota archaeon]
MNFANYVDVAARQWGDALAMSDPTREMSYADLARETDAVANGLEDLGVEPGDRVALFLPNSVTFMTSYFGALKRGAVPVPINLRFDPQTIGYVLEDTDSSVVITSGHFEDTFADSDSSVELVVAHGETGIDYGAMVADAAKEYDVIERRSDDLAELLYTSGTTGQPKGVKHTHGNLTANGWAYVRYFTMYTLETVGLTVVPCFHVAGLNVTATPLVLVGAENHFLPTWDPETALETMAAREVTFGMFIPTMVVDMLEHGTDGYDLSALQYVGVGGSPMPKERIETVEDAFGVTLLEGYGMTETTPAAAVNRPDQNVRKAGSIGLPMHEVVDVRIEDPDTGEPVGTDEKGELLWHGDTVTPGYWNLPEENEAAFVERDDKRWLRSGDIARRDADGHLFVEDRADDMIITGGENVYPREVEDVVYEVDGVVEVGVVGMPDDRLGEQVTAIVVAEDSVTAESIESRCRDRLPGYKVPRAIEFADEIPKTPTMKIDKIALRRGLGVE